MAQNAFAEDKLLNDGAQDGDAQRSAQRVRHHREEVLHIVGQVQQFLKDAQHKDACDAAGNRQPARLPVYHAEVQHRLPVNHFHHGDDADGEESAQRDGPSHAASGQQLLRKDFDVASLFQ